MYLLKLLLLQKFVLIDADQRHKKHIVLICFILQLLFKLDRLMSQSDWMWSVKGLPYDPILTQPFCCTAGIQQIFPDSGLLLRITFWFASCLTFSFIFMKEAKLPKHFYLKSFRGFVGVWVVSGLAECTASLHLVLFFNRFDGRGGGCTSTTTQFQLCNHGLYIYCRKRQIWLCFNHLFI